MRHRLLLLLLLLVTIVPGAADAQQTDPVQVTERGVLLNFQNADLRLVIAALAEAGGLNVSYSDLPARRVTLRTNQPVARADIAALLRSVAESNGLSVVEEGGFFRVHATDTRVGAPADTASTGLRLFVYRLRHARADRLAATLQSVFGNSSARGRQAGGIRQAPLSERMRERQIPPAGDEADVAVDVELAPVEPSLPGELTGDVQIVPDELTNALLVRAQPADWEIVRQAIETLDLRPLQVLIEGLIVEVRRTSDFELGVSGEGSDDNATGATSIGGILDDTGRLVVEVMRLGGIDLDVALSAFSAAGRVRILSRPVILAQNNQEARILVGAERPFIQVFRSLPTEAPIRDQIVQYRDVGTSLTILPTINPDGYINLQVLQEVSTATEETQFGAPVISTREAATHLFVRDGQTIVIGGLIEQQRSSTRTGVPILKDIPGLGALFGSTRDNSTQAELFLFLTPHIVADDDDVDRVRRGVEQGSDLLREQLPERPTILPPDTVRDGAGR